ncbi:MAG: GNAT family N-acetyltransferase [candidate division WOR-3 bacterium]|nr:GNAT family N-acetyltransferase [candidate division WOR-3 bacterium]
MVIKNVNSKNVDDLVFFCIPQNKRTNPNYLAGAAEKRKWALSILKEYGEVAKLAYIGSKPVGLIQYHPILSQKVIKIRCIFVPDKEYTRKGIGSALLRSLILDMKKPKLYLNNQSPFALITYAFETPAGYSQYLFYQKMGFTAIDVKEKLLYYSLKENFIYHPSEKKPSRSLKKDMGKALIFYEPFCPYSIVFAKEIKRVINEIAPKLPVELINMFEKPKEFLKRNPSTACIINTKPIYSFVLDKENFIKEVKDALTLYNGGNYEV